MKVLHYLKWMRKRDGGVVNCVMQLAPLQASHGAQVVVLTADADDVPRDTWRHLHPAQSSEAFAPGKPACIALPLRDRIAELRGTSAQSAERDTPSQLLTRSALATARDVITQCDILHIHGPWSSSNLQLAARARKLGKPYVVSAHGMLDDWSMAQSAAKKRLFLRLFSASMLNGARAIHCAAEAEAAQVSRHTTAPTRVVALPMDLSPFARLPGPQLARERLGLREHVPTLLFLSRLHPKKGAEHAIDALAILRGQGIDCDLILAGPRQDPIYAATLEARVRHHNLAAHARFVGMVEGDLKLSLYQAAAAFVLPTSQENFGFVLLESLLAGTPVVTTQGVDLWRELEQSGGATITQADGASLADAVRPLLSPATRDAMAHAGGAWARRLLDARNLVHAYLAMYRGM